jgi:hypothetical protein
MRIYTLVTDSGTATSVHADRAHAVQALALRALDLTTLPDLPTTTEEMNKTEDLIISRGYWFSIDSHDLPEGLHVCLCDALLPCPIHQEN